MAVVVVQAAVAVEIPPIQTPEEVEITVVEVEVEAMVFLKDN